MRCNATGFCTLLISAAALCLLFGIGWLVSFPPGDPSPRDLQPVSPVDQLPEPAQHDWDLSQMKVAVRGGQFAWRYQLPGPDGKFDTGDDVRVKDEVHLPVDSEIELLIESDDFVYTLLIPALDLRRIAIPELVYKLSFRTSRTGEFEVVADPTCSVRLFHDEEMGSVVVEPEADFKLWYQRQQGS